MGRNTGLQAALLVWSGMIVIGLIDNYVRLLTPVTSLWMFHLVRSLMVLGALVGLGLVLGWRLWPRRVGRVMARNLFSGAAMFLYFGSLAFVPIGVAVAGLFTAPLFVLVLSALFRAEQVGWVRWGAAALGFAGALLVIQPEEGAITWAAFIPVLAGAFYAIGAIATRSWCEGEGTVPMLVSYYIVIGTGAALGLGSLMLWPQVAEPGAAGFVARGWVAPDLFFWLWMLAHAAGSLIGVACLTRGYQVGEATYVAINEYSLILFASILAWLIWGETVGPLALTGMAMIVAAGAVIPLRSADQAPTPPQTSGSPSSTS